MIDLLPDRTSETLAQWLKQHPQIEIVARDRSTDYAVGIRQGAPQATQVADRWHLLHNLRQMLQRYLTTCYSHLKQLPLTPEYEVLLAQKRPVYRRTQTEQQASKASRDRRVALYEQIQLLKQDGKNHFSGGTPISGHTQTLDCGRTFGWFNYSRRLSKDYEERPDISEAMIYLSMTRIMLKRLHLL